MQRIVKGVRELEALLEAVAKELEKLADEIRKLLAEMSDK